MLFRKWRRNVTFVTNFMEIDKKSPLPIYYQIQQIITEKIKSGELKPGDKIPSEHELCEQFGVSRMTIRQAINNLVKETQLYRKRGIGTFVQQTKVTQALEGLSSFTEDMKARGLNPSSKLISFAVKPASLYVAKHLGIEIESDIYEIQRIRLADNEPIAIERAYIPVYILPSLSVDTVQQSIYQYVETESGHKLIRAVQEIEATIVNEEDAKWLEIEEGAPILILEQCSYIEGDIPLEFVRCSYRADRYKFMTHVKRRVE